MFFFAPARVLQMLLCHCEPTAHSDHSSSQRFLLNTLWEEKGRICTPMIAANHSMGPACKGRILDPYSWCEFTRSVPTAEQQVSSLGHSEIQAFHIPHKVIVMNHLSTLPEAMPAHHESMLPEYHDGMMNLQNKYNP